MSFIFAPYTFFFLPHNNVLTGREAERALSRYKDIDFKKKQKLLKRNAPSRPVQQMVRAAILLDRF